MVTKEKAPSQDIINCTVLYCGKLGADFDVAEALDMSQKTEVRRDITFAGLHMDDNAKLIEELDGIM